MHAYKESCKHKLVNMPITAHAVAFGVTVDEMTKTRDEREIVSMPAKEDSDSLISRVMELYMNVILMLHAIYCCFVSGAPFIRRPSTG